MQVFFTGKEEHTFFVVSPKKLDYQDGFQETQLKGGFTQSTHYYPVQQIQDSDEKEEEQRAEPKKLRD